MPPRPALYNYNLFTFTHFIRGLVLAFISLSLLFSTLVAQVEKEVLALELGKPIQRELAGDAADSYTLTLATNQYIHLVVEQRGIDVVVKLFAPDGRKLVEVDSPNGTVGPEPVEMLTESAGVYRLEVRSLEKGAAGNYVVTLTEKRAATADDREQIAKQALIEQSRDLSNQADALSKQGRYKDAMPLAQRSLEILEKACGPEHPDVANALNNLAQLCQDTGDYAGALPRYQRALAIWEKALGPEDTRVAGGLNNLAELYLDTGEYALAGPLYQRSLAIREKALGPEHTDVAESLNNLAALYRATGDYARAEPFYQRSLAIREKLLGPEHRDVAQSLNNLAVLYQTTGDYTRAASLYLRALAIWEKGLGPEHREVATALNNLGVLYQIVGDYTRSTSLLQRSLAIREKNLGPEHPDVAQSLHNLALSYRYTGDYTRAEQLFKRAIAIREKVLGLEHPAVGTALNNLAVLYRLTGDYTRALPLYQRALAIREKALGPNHQDVAQSLNNLAEVYRATGDYTSAAPLYQRALAIFEKALEPEHPDIATTLNNMASLHRAMGEYAEAVPLYQRAADLREKTIVAILEMGSQQQKQLYLNTLAAEISIAVSLHARDIPQDAGAARLALTTILRRKGRALDAFAGQLEILRRRAVPEDKKLLDDLTAVQTYLSNLKLGGGRLKPAARRAEISRLSAEQERLEDAISRRSAEFRAARQPVTLERVQLAIPTNSALVELFVYTPFNAKSKNAAERFGARRYVAYVVRTKDAAPRSVDLGEAAPIDADAAKFRAALQSDATPLTQVKRLARGLDERVMRPVRKLLGPVKRVLIAPDGALNLVPFDAFVDETGHYLIENYSFNYLTSGRDLLRLQVAAESLEAPVIVANPFFDMKDPLSAKPNGRLAIGLLGANETASAETRTTDFRGLYYPPLAGTAAEAKSIGALLPGARILTQGDATEAKLKTIRRPRILHIATHGFFLPDEQQPLSSGGRQLPASDSSSPSVLQQESPMLRSGLILAGANQKQSGEGEDGILTAQEAAGLDLFGTKLVVLSACETGLGEVLNGAGVYGLRRALVLAGSRTQVMSLWRVSDIATRDLMIAYYTRLQSGEGRIDAMRQVQLAMLRGTPLVKNGRRRGSGIANVKVSNQWRHPYYWAAFIPSGAWTTLDDKEAK